MQEDGIRIAMGHQGTRQRSQAGCSSLPARRKKQGWSGVTPAAHVRTTCVRPLPAYEQRGHTGPPRPAAWAAAEGRGLARQAANERGRSSLLGAVTRGRGSR